MKHKNNATSTYRCLTAERLLDENEHEHIACSCIAKRIAALLAENSKLREVVEAAKLVTTERKLSWYRALSEALKKLETTNG